MQKTDNLLWFWLTSAPNRTSRDGGQSIGDSSSARVLYPYGEVTPLSDGTHTERLLWPVPVNATLRRLRPMVNRKTGLFRRRKYARSSLIYIQACLERTEARAELFKVPEMEKKLS